MKKGVIDLISGQQPPSTSMFSLSSDQQHISSMDAAVSPTAAPISFHSGPPAIPDQPVRNEKRRLASQSQQRSSKRSRT